MSEAGIDRANNAKAVLEAPAYKDAYQAVRNALIERIERCPMADVATAEDLRRCLKLLRDVQLNMEIAVNSGVLDQFNLEQQKKRAVRDAARRLFGR
jgi:uncharacterized small protein (DUF1192 family)